MRNIVLLVMAFPVAANAQVERLVIGQNGMEWRQASEDLLGLDDSVSVGSLQPFELNPLVNIAVGAQTEKGQLTNILGYVWGTSPRGPPASVKDKTCWVYGSRGPTLAIDGDVDQPTHSWIISGYTFDLGLTVPVNRVVFFPPKSGRIADGPEAGSLFRDLYPRQYVISGSRNPQEFLFKDTREDFHRVLNSNFSHDEHVADVRFPTQLIRFARVRFPAPGFVAEVEFYGEGFLPETRFISQLFDMGEPVNLGRLFYDFEILRSPGFGRDPAPAPEAPVQVAVEVRSGRDDSPLIYHIITELGTEGAVEFKEWARAPSPIGATQSKGLPGQQGAILDDVANWSFWSVPHRESGEDIRSPDGRQFVQVRAFITSEEVFAFGRLNSLAIEFSPLLANPVVGEVALMDEPEPAGGVAEVPLGERVILTYDVRADFTSAEQVGFDAIRLRTPEAVDFQRFEMGDPLRVVVPDSVWVDDRELVVSFPSRPVTQAANVPLRLTFGTRVFNFNTVFEGEVFQIGGVNLAQSIDGGDASPRVSTNDLQVFAPLERLEVLTGVDLGAGVLTPNGDGVNDLLTLSYTLQGISAGDVVVAIHDLTGRLVRQFVAESRGEGRYTDVWDGRSGGRLVVPGLYLVRVAVDTDLGVFDQIRTVAVAF